jgi:cobalt-precorrin 5A hydrolase
MGFAAPDVTKSPANEPSERSGIAIVALTRSGVQLALQLQAQLAESVCHVPMRHRFALSMAAQGFHKLADLMRELWSNRRAIICIMASGIVVRQIAPLLDHKSRDPAVVVVDELGRFAVSLVSGHLGGANRLAIRVAEITGGQAVITTASDVQHRPALDLIAREAGLKIENPEMVSRLARALLEDELIWVFDPDRRLEPYLQEVSNVIRCSSPSEVRPDLGGQGSSEQIPPSAAGEAPRSAAGIWVSERLVPEGLCCLMLRPANLVVGIGCNRGTAAREIVELLEHVFLREGLSPLSVRNLASIDLKADEPGLREAAHLLDVPIEFFAKEHISRVTVPSPSPVVEQHIGVPNVCEATALLSAKSPDFAALIVPKQKTANVTLAVARVSCPL